MKQLCMWMLAFSFFSATAQISFKTGSVQLDTDLNTINARASADFGAFKTDMKLSYNVSEKSIEYMTGNLNMGFGEVYLALEIAKITRKPLNDVLVCYETHKSKGWGYIAKQMGIKPGSAEFHQLKNSANSKKGKGAGKKQSKGKGKKH
ncbi:hypothetical protein [Mangrovimonas sp. DI 80]|uniref:hypothetical protein n=1 Tax=Mangrovimonas sp. DI 80 TaxID=1779330 RepID=UPI000F4DA742|nr:hypothetical protein [Mangrovimonas sp. DI 80]